MKLTRSSRPMGVDLFCLDRSFLVTNLVSRNLKIKYRRSSLGILWTLVVPMATAAIYYFVFQVVMKVTLDNYLILILSGVLPWTFYTQSINEGVSSIVDNESLLSKVPVPVQVFPFVGTVTNVVTLMISFPVIFAAGFLSGPPVGWTYMFFFLFIGLLFLQAYAFATVFSIIYVHLRDLKHIIGLTTQIWLYGTPVLYRESMIPERYSWILYANPAAMIFVGIHQTMVDGIMPTGEVLAVSVAWTITLLYGAVLLLKKMGRSVVEKL